jgi:putative membrane protein
MRWILKIILFPIILLLSILISFLKLITSVSGMILGILSFLVVLGSISALVQKDTTTFIQILIIAFLISSYGLPKISLWVTAYIEFASDRLKEI